MRLLIFNPETEYALASGASFYTPPARVVALRKERQLLPETWAGDGDVILVDDVEGCSSGFRLVDWSLLEDLFRENPDITIEPWGWNKALRRRLADSGVPLSALPDEQYIEMIRNLAHRRTTVRLNTIWNEMAEECERVPVPTELFSEDECVDFFRKHPGCWMKAPWSSSGRGVVNTAADMEEVHVRQWCRGIIRRQGSVMAETGADRVADYATEWILRQGVANYIGLSSFVTSNRGKYLSNNIKRQSEMTVEFDSMCRLRLMDIAERQKRIIEEVYKGYDGPLGIDMIIEGDGSVRPFVEVNLRRTMGMVYLSES